MSLSVFSEPSGSGVGQMLNQCPKDKRIKKGNFVLTNSAGLLGMVWVRKRRPEHFSRMLGRMPPTVLWTGSSLSRVPAS